jgi:hypothetical protein
MSKTTNKQKVECLNAWLSERNKSPKYKRLKSTKKYDEVMD